MDVKGHNYKKIHINSRHYGHSKDLKALKRELNDTAGRIDALRLDMDMQQKTLKMLEQEYKKDKSKSSLEAVSSKRREIECIQKNILKEEGMQCKLLKDFEYETTKKNAEAAYLSQQRSKTKTGGRNSLNLKSEVKRFKTGVRNAQKLAKAYTDDNDGGKAAQATIESASGIITKAGQRTYRTAAYIPKKVIKIAAKNAAKAVIKVSANIIKHLAGIIAGLISKLVTALAASSAGVLLIILIAFLMIIILVTKFDIGWFIGGNPDMTASNSRYTEVRDYLVSQQEAFNKQIKREAGNDIPITDDDPDNINDIMITYVCLTFNFENYNSEKLTDKDKDKLKDIFYTMCEYSFDEKQPEDKETDENGKKPEPEITGCTVTRHNLSWAIKEFEFTKEQLATLEIISELSGGTISADGRVMLSDSGSQIISGYVPDIGISVRWPTDSHIITSAYGDTADRSRAHKGVDVAPLSGGVSGDPIYVVADGVVKIAQWNNETAGNYVAVTHEGGLYTRYLHMCDITVSEGDTVKKGQIIGHMGTTGDSTGVHLHFDFSFNGSYINPMAYLKTD